MSPQALSAPPAARYRQILDVLRARIESGAYPIDSSLPTEMELCEEFGASRYTVREALRWLVQQGMVRRRQGSGSVVIAARPQRKYMQSLNSLADLFQFALDTHFVYEPTTTVTLSAEMADSIGGRAGSTWALVKGMRWTRPGGDMVCYTHSYIPKRLMKYAGELPGRVGAFYAHLEARSGEEVVEAVQEIRTERASRDVAAHLGIEVGQVTLCVQRRYISHEGTLITSLNWHVAENFVYRTQIYRNR